MGTYRLGSGDDLLISGFPVAVADIVHNGSGEDEAVLHHDAHLGTQGMDGVLGNVVAINENLPGIYIIEAADQVDNGRFAGSCGAYDGVGFTLLYLEINVV